MPGQDRIERMLREVWQRCRLRFEQALRPFEIAGEEIAGDDASCFSIDEDDVHHLMAVVHLHRAKSDLARQSLVCSQE
mgnify:CR=1 FL=1